MPKTSLPLTAARIKTITAAAAIDGRRRVIADGRHLVLVVTAARASWAVTYTTDGRARRVVIGAYPEMSLSGARIKAAAVRQDVAAGADPINDRRADDATLAAVAAAYIDHASKGRSAGYAPRAARLLREVLDVLGARPVGTIRPPELLDVIRRVERRSACTARQTLATVRRVLAFAVAVGLVDNNAAAGLAVALDRAPAAHHYPTVTDPDAARALYRAISGYQGDPVTRAALLLQMLLAVRPANLRGARWSDIDLDRGVWTIPAEELKIKGRPAFAVALPSQAIEILRGLHRLTGRGALAFPNRRDRARPISSGTLGAALARLGYRGIVTPHGLRASLRTIAAERLDVPAPVLEVALAHDVDPLHGAYDRAEYVDQRRAALNRYAALLSAPSARAAA